MDFRQILIKYWGYPGFRPLQEDIIRSVYEGKDTLGLLPTGGGKSLTFQVPALAKEGICLVITPLIALMKDQVENLQKKEIKAMAIHSGLSRNEIDIALDNCIYGDYKFLYLSPERLQTEMFRARVSKMNVNLIAVDESHCISQWGYDFRPSYLKIAELRDFLPGVPVLALTATATGKVVEDIMDRLNFSGRTVFRKSFERKNLVYMVEKTDDKAGRTLRYCSQIKGSGIIYVRNRKKTREIAELLKKNGISADYYHAGLKHEIRSLKQEQWKKGKTRIISATNAFGMGIDKPDVRFVIHLDLPDSPEAYFQEAGRAGRDEKEAVAILFYSEADKKMALRRVDTSFPDFAIIRKVYNALGNYLQVPLGGGKGQSYDFVISDFLHRYKFNALEAHNSLIVLEKEGYLELSNDIHNPSRVHFVIERDDLYKFQVSNEKFDGFIKLLLRSYTGLFSVYAGIDEDLLARRSGLSRDSVYSYLKLLKKQGIIDYIPRRSNPMVTLSEERLDENNLALDRNRYRFLKERFLKKLEAMLTYAGSDTKCRSQQLLEYFGEADSARCGKCDVCIKRNELDMSRQEFDSILSEIKSALGKQALLPNDLKDLSSFPVEKFSRVFRWLLEHRKIVAAEDGKYRWYLEK